MTEPEAEAVVVPPEVEIVHCCWAPLLWKNWAKVTGTAIAGLPARITVASRTAASEVLSIERIRFFISLLTLSLRDFVESFANL